jgi:hypothetical protein
MAHEGIAPPVVSQASEKEVVVPPANGNIVKEKALVPKSQKAAEGVLASKNDGQSSSSKKSAQEKSRKPRAPLKPIKEGVQASDDIRTRNMSEEHLKNPWKHFPCSQLKMAQMVRHLTSSFIFQNLHSLGPAHTKEKELPCCQGSGQRNRPCIMLTFCMKRITSSSPRFWILQSSKVYPISIAPLSRFNLSS